MSEVYKLLRLYGFSLSYLIDDALFAVGTRQGSNSQVKTICMLFTAPGFYLSWDKCSFVPVQQGKFLKVSLTVDSAKSELRHAHTVCLLTKYSISWMPSMRCCLQTRLLTGSLLVMQEC